MKYVTSYDSSSDDDDDDIRSVPASSFQNMKSFLRRRPKEMDSPKKKEEEKEEEQEEEVVGKREDKDKQSKGKIRVQISVSEEENNSASGDAVADSSGSDSDGHISSDDPELAAFVERVVDLPKPVEKPPKSYQDLMAEADMKVKVEAKLKEISKKSKQEPKRNSGRMPKTKSNAKASGSMHDMLKNANESKPKAWGSMRVMLNNIDNG